MENNVQGISPSLFISSMCSIDTAKAGVKSQFQGVSECHRVHGLGTQTRDWVLSQSRGALRIAICEGLVLITQQILV